MLRNMFSLLSGRGEGAVLCTLLFHKVPVQYDPIAPHEPALDQVAQSLEFIRRKFTVLPLQEALALRRRGRLPARTMALTFDDGYIDWPRSIVPLLLSLKLPATFFITTEQFDLERLWSERIVDIVRALPANVSPSSRALAGLVDASGQVDRVRLVAALTSRLKYMTPDARGQFLDALEAEFGMPPLQRGEGLRAEEVRRMHEQGFEIGAHSHRHPILSTLDEAQSLQEIATSKRRLEEALGAPIQGFAYPNGIPGKDYNRTHIRQLKEAGFVYATTTSGGVLRRRDDCFEIPRVSLWSSLPSRITTQLVRHYARAPETAPAAETTAPRVLLVASTFPPVHGGSAVVYDNLCKHYEPGAIHVLTAESDYRTGQPHPGCLEADARRCYPVHRLPLLRPQINASPVNIVHSAWRYATTDIPIFLRALLEARSIVRRHGIEAVCIGELNASGLLGVWIKRLTGCKLLIYVHGEEVTQRRAGYFNGPVRMKYLAQADQVIAVSHFTADALQTHLRVPTSKITVIHNGVDLERFTPAESVQAPATSGQPAGLHMLSVARLTPRKGVDQTLRAVARVAPQLPGLRYTVAGAGEQLPELQQLVQQLGLQDVVRFVGPVSDDEVLALYRACDLFVMPNRTLDDGDTEGFGLVFLEANACGKPVIGGRAGGAVEAIRHEFSGLLVDGNSVDDVASALLRLLKDPVLRDRMSADALQHARQHNIRLVSARFANTVRDVLRATGAAGTSHLTGR